MIHYLTTLSVKKIVPTVIATVPDKKKLERLMRREGTAFYGLFSVVAFSFGEGRGKELRHVTDKRV